MANAGELTHRVHYLLLLHYMLSASTTNICYTIFSSIICGLYAMMVFVEMLFSFWPCLTHNYIVFHWGIIRFLS